MSRKSRKKYLQAWRKKNHASTLRKARDYKEANREKITAYRAEYARKNRDLLSAKDYFWKMGISAYDIPPDLLKMKIEQLRFSRKLKKLRKDFRNGST